MQNYNELMLKILKGMDPSGTKKEPTNPTPAQNLNEQIIAVNKEAADEKMDPEKGVALKSKKKASAREKNEPALQEARRVARELAKNGPITMDDVTRELSGTRDVLAKRKCTDNNWKGSVFDSSEWVAVGRIASRIPEAHGRMVIQWALKSWLDEHSMNGTNSPVSAFNLSKILSQFKKKNECKDSELKWVIGDDVSDEFIRDGKCLGIDVERVHGSGAILLKK